MVAQRLAGPRWQTPLEAVRHLGAVRAQDLPGALTSVALRVLRGSREDVRAALNSGQIVRTWPMRGTLHLVPAEDAGWMMAITGDRIESGLRTRLTEMGIDDAALGSVPCRRGRRGARRGQGTDPCRADGALGGGGSAGATPDRALPAARALRRRSAGARPDDRLRAAGGRSRRLGPRSPPPGR